MIDNDPNNKFAKTSNDKIVINLFKIVMLLKKIFKLKFKLLII